MATAHGISVSRGRGKTPEFEPVFVHDWATDLRLMANFAQLIPKRILTLPRLGFDNFHHCDTVLPSYPGHDPIGAMLRDSKTHVVITLHRMDVVTYGIIYHYLFEHSRLYALIYI